MAEPIPPYSNTMESRIFERDAPPGSGRPGFVARPLTVSLIIGMMGAAALFFLSKQLAVQTDAMDFVRTMLVSTLMNLCLFKYVKRSLDRLEQDKTGLNKVHEKQKAQFDQCSAELAKTTMDLCHAMENTKLLELQLRKNREHYLGILETMEDEYFETNLAGIHTHVNQAACKNSGYSFEEHVGLTYRDIAATSEVADQIYQAFNRVYKTGIPAKIVDHQVKTKDGILRFLEMSASLIRDEFGKPIGFRGIARDVTRRKKIEADLKQSEERYRTILDSMVDGYYEVDPAGHFTFVNPAMTQILGYDRNDLIGMHYKTYLDNDQAGKVFEVFNRVFTTGVPDKGIGYEITRKDGRKRCVEATVALMTDAQQNRTGFRGVLRDISDRRIASG